jgi:hypothetical protein
MLAQTGVLGVIAYSYQHRGGRWESDHFFAGFAISSFTV